MNVRRLAVCLALFSSACVSGLSLDERQCPCATGWQCCPGANVCVEEGTSCPAPDAGAPDAGPSIAVVAGRRGGAGYADDVGGDARFTYPAAITGDGQNTLYIVDDLLTGPTSGLIRELDLPSGRVTTLARGFGKQSPYRVCLSGTDLYFNGIAGTHTGEVLLKADTRTGLVSFVAGGGSTTSVSEDGGGYTTPADGVGSAASFIAIQALACDDAGHVFVADGEALGALYAGIRQLDTSTGAVTTVLGGQSGDPSVFGPVGAYDTLFGLTWDDKGDLYFGLGATIRELTLSTKTVTTLGTLSTINFPSGADPQPLSEGELPLASLASSSGGDLLVLDADLLLNFESGSAFAAAGAFSSSIEAGTPGDVDGNAAAAEMNQPLGLWVQGGNAYLADTGNYAIRRYAPGNPSTVSTIAGAGAHVGESDGAASQALLTAPTGVASDPAGNLYFSEAELDGTMIMTGVERAMREVSAGAVSTLPVYASGPLAVPQADRFVSDDANHQPPSVIVNDTAGDYVMFDGPFFGNPGTATFIDGLTGFSAPAGLAVDGAGNVYVADKGLDAVLEITSALAAPLEPVGSSTSAVVSEVADGFDAPLAVALDGAGNIYVAEATAVKKIAAGSHAVTTLASAAAGWKSIAALACDPAGFLYVADHDDHRVRALRLADGTLHDLAGVAGRVGVKTGALPGGLNGPAGLALLPSGDLAVTDQAENVVLVIHEPAKAVAP